LGQFAIANGNFLTKHRDISGLLAFSIFQSNLASMQGYQNPVYPYYFADPFVWKYRGIYYAVGTGPIAPLENPQEEDFTTSEVNGKHMVFPLLTSVDLVSWELIGGALEAPRFLHGGVFWAPEVAYHDGWFYLYYSVATEGLKHKLRVAKSSSPRGPFQDVQALMREPNTCPFAIDAHPFHDSDGQWYLFYATDFLEAKDQSRAGTALMIDRLVNMVALAGEGRVVLRARSDWQRFQSNREMYGQVFDWHTLEGPCVQMHDNKYYCFYSGGCYQGAGYGVDYGTAPTVWGPYSDEGNEHGARVLRSEPGHVLGPGHHCIVKAPDDHTDMVVYHAWDPAMIARRMCIDPLVWTVDGPRCAGPTWTPQILSRRELCQ
jgi:GH43 family beta-xylosidase